MNFKKLVVGILAGAVLVVGVATAEAKSRVSSKPSFSKPSYSQPKVVSRPAVVSKPYVAPTTRVVTKQTPVYRAPAQKTTIIQKNYYGGGNRGYSNNGYSNSGSYGSGGAGMGSSIVGGAVGAVGGVMLLDALTEDEGEKALKLQEQERLVEEAKAQQARDDEQAQIAAQQQEILEKQAQGYPLPQGTPLMMLPKQ